MEKRAEEYIEKTQRKKDMLDKKNEIQSKEEQPHRVNSKYGIFNNRYTTNRKNK